MIDHPIVVAHYCLVKANISEFPVDLRGALGALGYGCASFSETAQRSNCQIEDIAAFVKSWDGGSIVTGGVITIAYNEKRPTTRSHFTIVHELGHHLLGHVDDRTKTYAQKENEANDFARNFLAPPVAFELWKSPNEEFRVRYSSWYFGISHACVYNRIKHLAADIAVLKDAGLYAAQRERFEPYIRENPLGKQTGNKCVSTKSKSCGVYLAPEIKKCPLCGSVTMEFLETLVRPLDEFAKQRRYPRF